MKKNIKKRIVQLSFLGLILCVLTFLYVLPEIKFLFLKWKFNAAGGALIFREKLYDLKTTLLDSTYGLVRFPELDLPVEHPLHKLQPQLISLKSYESGITYYHIQMSGGFNHVGYLVFESTNKIPTTIRLGQNGSWKVKYIGDGVFVYQE